MSIQLPLASAADSPWMQLLAGTPAGSAAVAAAAGEAGAPDTTPAQLEKAVHEANASMALRSVDVRFEIDKDIDKVIVKVVDKSSGEVIRQIPSEEVVRIAKVLEGKLPGLLVSHGA